MFVRVPAAATAVARLGSASLPWRVRCAVPRPRQLCLPWQQQAASNGGCFAAGSSPSSSPAPGGGGATPSGSRCSWSSAPAARGQQGAGWSPGSRKICRQYRAAERFRHNEPAALRKLLHLVAHRPPHPQGRVDAVTNRGCGSVQAAVHMPSSTTYSGGAGQRAGQHHNDSASPSAHPGSGRGSGRRAGWAGCPAPAGAAAPAAPAPRSPGLQGGVARQRDRDTRRVELGTGGRRCRGQLRSSPQLSSATLAKLSAHLKGTNATCACRRLQNQPNQTLLAHLCPPVPPAPLRCVPLAPPPPAAAAPAAAAPCWASAAQQDGL